MMEFDDDVEIPAWKQHPILLVDDEPEILRSLQRLLKMEDFNVTTASNGEEGLELLKVVPAKLVISDQKMEPHMSGTEFLTKVKERYPHVVTAVLSAYTEPTMVINAVNKAGAYLYLTKPWNNVDLVSRTEQCLRYYHAESERKRMAEANQALLRRMAMHESNLVMANLSGALFDRFFPVLRRLLRDAKRRASKYSPDSDEHFRSLLEQERWAELCISLNKLRLLADFYDEPPNYRHEGLELHVRRHVEEAIARSAAQGLKVPIEQRYEANLPKLWLDESNLTFATRALIENAVLAAAQASEGCVKVHVHEDEHNDERVVCVDVEDTGNGVAEGLAGKIFSPLFSTRSAPVDEVEEVLSLGEYNFYPYGHVGLGLSLAQTCTIQHDGEVQLLNPGSQGAIFRIAIPFNQESLRREGGLQPG